MQNVQRYLLSVITLKPQWIRSAVIKSFGLNRINLWAGFKQIHELDKFILFYIRRNGVKND